MFIWSKLLDNHRIRPINSWGEITVSFNLEYIRIQNKMRLDFLTIFRIVPFLYHVLFDYPIPFPPGVEIRPW